MGPTGPTGPGVPSQTGNAGELLVTDGTDASWSNTVTANTSSSKGLIVKGAASQSANLQEWQDSSGTAVASVLADGSVLSRGDLRVGWGNVADEGKSLLFYANSATPYSPSSSIYASYLGDLFFDAPGGMTLYSSAGLIQIGAPLVATPSEPTSAASAASSVGYVGMPQISVAFAISSTNPNWVTCAGKHIYTTTNGLTHTIPANSSYPFEIGTTFVFINPASVTTTIAIATDTLILAGTGTTGSRTLAPYGMATAVKITATSWMISGNGLT